MTLNFSKVAFQYGPSDGFIIPLKQFARKEKFVIKGIEGLDGPDIDVGLGQKIYEGSVFQGSRPQDREITINLGLQPDYRIGETYSDLRAQLYGLIASKYGYDLTFILMDNDNKIQASVTGRVKSCHANPFSKVAGDTQLVISCFSAYLDGPRYTMLNPTLQLTNPLAFVNPGNAPTGFSLQITLGAFAEYADSFTLSKAATYGEVLKFTPLSHFIPTDVIVLSTENGKRQAFYYRSNGSDDGNLASYDKLNLLPYISTTSKWFQLHAETNTLLVKMDNTFISKYRVDSLSFTPKYWGV